MGGDEFVLVRVTVDPHQELEVGHRRVLMTIAEALGALLTPRVVVEHGNIHEPRAQRLDMLGLVFDLAQLSHQPLRLDLLRLVVNQI